LGISDGGDRDAACGGGTVHVFQVEAVAVSGCD
jgi:hypothetical protein